MAWPFSRLTTYVAGSTPSIKAADLNAIQDRIIALGAGAALFFGSGVDGAAVADGAGSIPGATRSGSVYTLQRDVFYTDLTLSAGVEIKRNGYRVYCNGTCTVPATAKITSNGTAGGPLNTDSGAGGASGSLAGGGTAGVGGTNLSYAGTAGSSVTNSRSGAGGKGGDGGDPGSFQAGAAGGTTTAPVAGLGGSVSDLLWTLQTGFVAGYNAGSNFVQPLFGGGGGGGGAGGDDLGGNTGKGGAGGGGAGVGVLCAKNLILDGTIECNGGDGGPGQIVGGVGSSGGGGGGGGGDNMVVFGTKSGSGSVTSNGGAGGAPSGTYPAGAAGAAGRVLQVQVSP